MVFLKCRFNFFLFKYWFTNRLQTYNIFSKRRKELRKNYCNLKKNAYLCSRNGSTKTLLFLPIKRESGANPEQSRCCEFFNILLDNSCHCLLSKRKWEGVLQGTSQKTCRAFI